ncbi:MAG: hypothetical protein HYY08_02460 [Firmicutes bacterium]|nr:hypothetical protein [Bacillota bacterium]
MKKLAIVLMAVAMVMVLSVGLVYAHGGGRAFAVKINSDDYEVAVDGVLDDDAWKMAIPFYIVADTADGGILTPKFQQFGTHATSAANLGFAGVEHEGIKDTSGIFYILWDDNNLYMAAQVYDDKIMGSLRNPWEQDGIEWYLGTSHDGKSARQIFVSILKENKPIPDGVVTSVPEATIAASINSEKSYYTIEIAYPLSALALSPAEGATIGFEMEIDDLDDPAVGRNHKVGWSSGQNMAWNTPSLHGDLTFLGLAPEELQP